MGLRERKKLATRQMISDVATKLFGERGFDSVTIDEVAAAADVSKMTVFNYFARKEDLLFDKADVVQPLIAAALAARGRRSPIAALHALVHELIEEDHGLARIWAGSAKFWKIVADSSALRARTSELNEQLEKDLARMLADSTGAGKADPIARLIAALLLAAWRTAFREGLRRHHTARATRAAMVELVDRGFAAAKAAARETPYVTSG